jgi:LAO/AO transport system kinase
VILIETVGVGQDEVEIVRTADVSIVTLVPGTGDDVQALKAGIMEIADVFVVNKADREGSDRLVTAIETSLTLHSYRSGEWRPPVLKTIATSGVGISDLIGAIAQFRAHSSRRVGESGRTQQEARRRSRMETRLRELVSQEFWSHIERHLMTRAELATIVDRLASRETDPYSAASELVGRALAQGPGRQVAGSPRA